LYASFAEPVADKALVIFAHGSGSSRLSSRNRFVAEVLQTEGFGTLLLDLLTESEDRVYENRFDIPLLARRLGEAIRWARAGQIGPNSPLALFGASTGAAAALIAAADIDEEIRTVVSRGGRPDLAGEALSRVHCPTLFIVGALDWEVIDLNRQAMREMPADTRVELAIVPGATHLFEESGTLSQAADLARNWFLKHASSVSN
jgi:dienelactone hydrolase